jgi:hypothetical protein
MSGDINNRLPPGSQKGRAAMGFWISGIDQSIVAMAKAGVENDPCVQNKMAYRPSEPCKALKSKSLTCEIMDASNEAKLPLQTEIPIMIVFFLEFRFSS